MTPPQKTEPGPTLLELLEDEALEAENHAEEARNIGYDAETVAGRETRAIDLRSAAARLREEMLSPQFVLHAKAIREVLLRVNGGPLASLPPGRGE